MKKLSELYPGRKIETIYAREILLGGGNIHCITQQVPKGKKQKIFKENYFSFFLCKITLH